MRPVAPPSPVMAALRLLEAKERKAKPAKKEVEPAAPVKKQPAKKGRAR